MSSDKQQQGFGVETWVGRYLEKHGLKLIQRNFSCKVGEIDLIMVDNDQLVFVEVRSRRNNRDGSPAETVTPAKQRRLIRCAGYYLQTKRINMPCRFDVVAVTGDEDDWNIEWIRNAFTA